MSKTSERHVTDAIPVFLIITVTAIVSLGTIAGIAFRPAHSEVALTRDTAHWPPPPPAPPENTPPE